MDSSKEEPPNGMEWRVPMPAESTAATGAHVAGPAPPLLLGAWTRIVTCTTALKTVVFGSANTVWQIGIGDPRKVMYGVKLGVALTLVSLLYYLRPMYHDVGGNAVWAIMTVVLAFEYTVGGTVSKGLNGTAGTMSAALLALGVHLAATKSGHRFEPAVASGSVFLLGAAAALARFVPIVALRFDYGVTAFILTYGYVAVSGYRVHELPVLALQRICSYSVGILICVAVSALVCPVWSGEQLHLLTARNMENLSMALEDCFAESEKSLRRWTESEGHGQCVLDSKAAEDAHANLAWWEPPHGRFAFRHPYHQYANVGAAMRRCACCLDALGSCVVKAQAPEPAARVLAEACTRVGDQCARVLREASGCVATMTVPRGLGLAVEEMNAAVHELQAGLGVVEQTDTSLAEAVQLFTAGSLLIEVSARVKEVVDAVHVLATLARFKLADDDEGSEKAHQTGAKVHPLNLNNASLQHPAPRTGL